MNSLGALLFFLGVAFSAVYVFPSGNPQPSDFLLVLGSAIILLRQLRAIKGFQLLWPMVGLTAWVFIVSTIWALLYPQGLFYRYPLFFTFNLVFMIALVNLYLRLRDPNLFLTRAAAVALLVSWTGVVVSVVAPGILLASESARIAGFFNNPNQLAYYSLCMLAVMLVLNEGKIPCYPLTLAACASGLLGVFLAASIGAVAGLMFLVLGFLAANWKHSGRFLKAVGTLLVIAGLAFGFDIYTEGAMSERIQARMDRLDRKMDAFETERGYHRIRAHPEYLVLGAGEGSAERFPEYGTNEIHSSFGNLLFSYGVVGLALFLLLLWKTLRDAPVYVWLIMAAPLTYSITHMGLRNTAFWFLLVLVGVMYDKGRNVRRRMKWSRLRWDGGRDVRASR